MILGNRNRAVSIELLDSIFGENPLEYHYLKEKVVPVTMVSNFFGFPKYPLSHKST